MPITAELENINKLESVGFDHDQAKTLAEVIEISHRDSQQNLKEFIRAEMSRLENRIEASEQRLETKIAETNGETLKSINDLLFKIFGIVFCSLTLAVAVLKLIL